MLRGGIQTMEFAEATGIVRCLANGRPVSKAQVRKIQEVCSADTRYRDTIAAELNMPAERLEEVLVRELETKPSFRRR
jgi:hypothetical protein